MILELTQLLWLKTPKGEGVARFLIDYGPEADLMWVVIQDSGELWTWSNLDVRASPNISLGRCSETGTKPPST
jgi:hypothetical protein